MTTLREALQQEMALNTELNPPSYVAKHEMRIVYERIKRLELQMEALSEKFVARATKSKTD